MYCLFKDKLESMQGMVLIVIIAKIITNGMHE